MQRTALSFAMATLVACGDNTSATGSDDGGAASTGTTGASTPTTSEGNPGTTSTGDATTAGSISESAEGSSSSGTPTTSGDTSTGGVTGSTSETGDTAMPFVCEPALAPAGPIAVDPACEGAPVKVVVDPWNIAIEWAYEIPGQGGYVMPAVGPLTDDDGDGDVDDDDIPAIAFNALGGTLTVLHGDGSGVAFTVPNLSGPYPGPAIADVDGDGAPEVLTINAGKRVVAVDGAGNIVWASPPVPEIESNGPQITVSDLDEDGDVEVIADVAIVDGKTGALITTLPANAAVTTPVIADLDLDGAKEIVLHRGVYSSEGVLLWSMPGNFAAAFAAVADIDGDPEGELFVALANQLHVREHDGTVIGQYVISGMGYPGPPCMADFDSDGAVEIAIPFGNQFNMMETDGTLVWKSPISDDSGAAGCSAYDVDGDGTFEIMYADQQDLRIYDGPTGTVRYTNPTHTSGTVWEYPVVADVDKDGSAEIIVLSQGLTHQLTVFGHAGDGWSASGRGWQVHDYAVTNINPDGSVPTSPEPSWATHNLFRARPTVDAPAVPDLRVEITDTCVDCAASDHVVYQVCNQGGADVAAGVPLTLFALADKIEVVVETRMLPEIAAGACLVGDSFVFDPALAVDGGVIVRLYDDGNGSGPASECDLGNDQAATELTGCGRN